MALSKISLKIEGIGKHHEETMRIDNKRGRINARFDMYKFVDKDTKQIVFYVPAIDVSGYGETEEKASDLVKFAMEEYFKYLVSLPMREMITELHTHNWRKNTFASKQYSRLYVDLGGSLKDLNAVDDKVERLSLTAV